MGMILQAPQPITAQHDTSSFSSGADLIDVWLRRRALRNQLTDASRTYVLCEKPNRVVAYYSLASGAVAPSETTGRFRRNMPDPIPVVILARLGVDLGWQGRGLGRALVSDALRRITRAADVVGIRGVVVHALNESAFSYYHHLGFDQSPGDPLMLMITCADVRKLLPELAHA